MEWLAVAKFAKDIWDTLGKVFKKRGFAGASTWLFRGSPLALRISAVGSLSVFLALTWYLWSVMWRPVHLVGGSLAAELEPTKQPNKGLEALILSDISGSFDTALKGARVNGDFVTKVQQLSKQSEVTLENSKKPGKPITLQVINTGAPASAVSSYLTDSYEGFLFVPGIVTSTWPLLENPTLSAFSLSSETDPSVYRDVKITQQLAPSLAALVQ